MLQDVEDVFQKREKRGVVLLDLNPGEATEELRAAGGIFFKAIRVKDDKAKARNGPEAKLVWRCVFKSDGVGMELASIEGDVGGLALRSFEIDDRGAAIVEANQAVELASDDATRGVAGNRKGDRFDPVFLSVKYAGRQCGQNISGAAAREVLAHLLVDDGEDLGHGYLRPAKVPCDLEPETPLALFPEEGEVGRVEGPDGFSHA